MDNALINNAWNDQPAPPTAQFASREAARQGHPPVSLQTTRRTIHHRIQQAVAEVFGLPISGFIARLMWHGIYLRKVPTLARKVRVFFEWNWAMLYPADIACQGFSITKRKTTNGQRRET